MMSCYFFPVPSNSHHYLVAKVPSPDRRVHHREEQFSYCGAFPVILNQPIGSFEWRFPIIKSLGFRVRVNRMYGSY